MARRIEVARKVPDTRTDVFLESIQREGIAANGPALSDVYTIDSGNVDLERLTGALTNPVTQRFSVDGSVAPEGWQVAVEKAKATGKEDWKSECKVQPIPLPAELVRDVGLMYTLGADRYRKMRIEKRLHAVRRSDGPAASAQGVKHDRP